MFIRSITTFCERYGRLCLVRVVGDDGTEGWGQVAPWQSHVAVEVLHRQLAGLVWHQAIDSPADLGTLLDEVTRKLYKYQGSHLWRAWSGIDLALWDFLGRRHGRPVASLIDPSGRHGGLRPLRAYASSMRRDLTADEEAERLLRLRDEFGYTAFKVRVGQPMGADTDASPGRTEAIIPCCRSRLGDSAALMADANGGFTPTRAVQVGRLLESHGYAHFEEPCPFWELEQTSQVASALRVPVAGGEQDCDVAQFRRMMRMRAVGIVQPDVCYAGGLTRCLRIAQEADALVLPVMPHSANRTLLLPASIHLMCAIPNPGAYVEVGIEDEPYFEGCWQPTVRIMDGMAHAPVGPGWGVVPDPNWLAQAETRENTRP